MVSVLLATALAPSIRGLAEETLFERLVLASHDKLPQNHISCLARLGDERLLAVWGSWAKNGPRDIVASFSADHGRSWSEPVKLNPASHGIDGDPNILVSGPRVLVAWTRWPSEKGISTTTTWCALSDDHGKTWNTPYQIPMNRAYTCGKTHRGLRLCSGTLLLGYSWDTFCEQGKTLAGEGQMHLRAGVMISTDDGKTWHNGGDTDAGYMRVSDRAVLGTDEPALVELDDGSIYILMRTGSDHLYQARSTDEGKTWTQIGPSPLYGSNAPAALCKFRAGGRRGIVCVWNNSLQRYPLSAAASFDGGRTWSKPKDLAGPTGGRKALLSKLRASGQRRAGGNLAAGIPRRLGHPRCAVQRGVARGGIKGTVAYIEEDGVFRQG